MIYVGDILSTSEGYHDLCGDVLSTLGDVQYIGGNHEYIGGNHEYIGGNHEYIGGYHKYIGVCSVHWGFQYESKAFINLLPT